MATGSINAQLALMAAGTISTNGSIFAEIDAAAKMGISNAVVAVLDVASVSAVTSKAITATASNVGTNAKLASNSPT